MRRAGHRDAHDESTSFSRSYASSANGFASRPRRSVRYGDHIDRIFVPAGLAVTDWEVVAPVRKGRNVRPIASDHHPVRATIVLP
jgi:endonuclease/exonuclease/phosphatase family metal-dependent hydrolase